MCQNDSTTILYDKTKYKEVGIACQKVCKQVRNDIKVKVVYKALSTPTSFCTPLAV